jgi:hypothetical protein
MGFANRSGYAVTNPSSPRAFAVCDSCGTHWNRNRLIDQYEWGGDGLIDQGFRNCPRCISKPQEQFRTPILPLDPIPIDDPRPEYPVLNQNLNGFIQVVGPQSDDIHIPVGGEFDPTCPHRNKNTMVLNLFWGKIPFPLLTDDSGIYPLSDDNGNILLQDNVIDRSGVVGISGVPVLIAPPNPSRKFILVYNPAAAVLGIAQGFPILGGQGTVVVGTGEAVTQNILVPPGQIWRGGIYGLGLIPRMPFYAWEL